MHGRRTILTGFFEGGCDFMGSALPLLLGGEEGMEFIRTWQQEYMVGIISK